MKDSSREGKKRASRTPGAPAPRGGGAERRKHRRVKVKLRMLYEDERKNVQADVIDLSMGGAFIEMASPAVEGTQIKLTPILPEQKPCPVQFTGKVVRVVEYDLSHAGGGKGIGVGVQFLGVSERERGLLSDIFRTSAAVRDEADEASERQTQAEEPTAPGAAAPADGGAAKEKE